MYNVNVNNKKQSILVDSLTKRYFQNDLCLLMCFSLFNGWFCIQYFFYPAKCWKNKQRTDSWRVNILICVKTISTQLEHMVMGSPLLQPPPTYEIMNIFVLNKTMTKWGRKKWSLNPGFVLKESTKQVIMKFYQATPFNLQDNWYSIVPNSFQYINKCAEK